MTNFIIDSYKMSHTDFFTFRNPIKSLKPEIISILGYTALGLLACRLKPSILPTDIAISFTKKTILCLASSSLNLSFISLVISATRLWSSSDFSKSYEASHKSENHLLNSSRDYLRASKWQFGRTFIYLAVSLLALHTLKRLSPSTSFDLSSLSLAHLTYDKLISYSRFSFVHKLFPFIIATVANYGLSKKTSYSLVRFIHKNEASLNLIEKYNLLGTEESFCEILEIIRDSSTLKPVVDHKKFNPNQRNIKSIVDNWWLGMEDRKYVLDKYKDSQNFPAIFADIFNASQVEGLDSHTVSIFMNYESINPNDILPGNEKPLFDLLIPYLNEAGFDQLMAKCRKSSDCPNNLMDQAFSVALYFNTGRDRSAILSKIIDDDTFNLNPLDTSLMILEEGDNTLFKKLITKYETKLEKEKFTKLLSDTFRQGILSLKNEDPYDYRIGVILKKLILITQNQHFELGSKEENTQLLNLLKFKCSENYQLSIILLPNTGLTAKEKIDLIFGCGRYNEESLKAAIVSGKFNYEYLLILDKTDKKVTVDKRDSFKTYIKDLENKDSENKLQRFSLEKQFLESYRDTPNIYLTPIEEQSEEKLN